MQNKLWVGICGWLVGGTVADCVNRVSIVGSDCQIGGIIGASQAGKVINCTNYGAIKGEYRVGGIIGYNDTGRIEKCMSNATIQAKYTVGGIAGRNNEGTISYCCNFGNVTGEDLVVGGIVGNNRGSIMYVCNRAEEIKITVGGGCDVGGIAGNQNTNSNAHVKYAYNTAKNGLGGIVGNFYLGTINRTYNLGILNTTATTDVGQIAGGKYNVSAITNSSGTTESEMKGWSQATITTNLGQFVKKENSLPILNIIIRDITF